MYLIKIHQQTVKFRVVLLTLAALMLFTPFLSLRASATTAPDTTVPPTTESAPPAFEEVTDAAENIILYCVEADMVLYDKDAYENFHPYALAKLVNILVAWDAIEDPYEVFTVEENMLDRFANSFGLKAGDQTSYADLIKMMLLRGFDDAACVLARKVAGNDEEFVRRMNEKAKELGAVDTVFENTTGRNDLGITTAYDCAIIGAAFTQNHVLMGWAGSDSLRMDTTDRRLYNRNYFLSIYYNGSGTQYLDSRCTGLIAGSVMDPRMLIASMDVGDYTYVAVVMNAAEDNGCAYAYEIVKKLVQDNLNVLHYITVLSPADLICEVPVNMGEGHDAVVVAPDKTFSFHVLRESVPEEEFNYEYELSETVLEAPVLSGTKVGELILYRNGREVGRCDLLTVANVGRSMSDYYRSEAQKAVNSRIFLKIVLVIGILAVIYVLAVAIYRGQKKRKIRQNRENQD
ncbi:MAG: D-alanyl-D-alanine carboxypeptidase family protein [Eubacteriales bacterium]